MDENNKNNINNDKNDQNTMEIPIVENAEFLDETSNDTLSEELSIDTKDGFLQYFKNKGRRWIPIYISSFIVIFTCFALYAAYIIPILEANGLIKGMAQIITPIMGADEPPNKTNVLLVGTDRGGYRTDTMMIATYDNEDGSVYVMQLPRDTYVGNNGRRDKKLNSAYFTGIDQLKYEIKLAYGIDIQKYLAVELDGFVEMVDKIGGIDIDVPINMNYDDPTPYQNLHIHLNKGYQHLDGNKAEQFVRFRKNNDGTGYPMGDIDRMEAQKNFIMALIQKTISMNGLSKISDLISIAQQNIKTDFVYDEAYSYIAKLLSISNDKIQFVEAPGEMDYRNRGWYFFVDAKGAKTTAVKYFYGNESVVVPSAPKPIATPKADIEVDNDVNDDERYTYYKKTPTPSVTPSSGVNSARSTARPSPTPTDGDMSGVKPTPTPSSGSKPTAKPNLNDSQEPKTTAKPVSTPAESGNIN